MAKAIYDHWGNRESSVNFIGSRVRDPEPYVIDEATAGTTFICYADTPNRAIRRITEADGITTVEWAYGAWEERASLNYVPINETVEVAE